LTIEYVRNWAN